MVWTKEDERFSIPSGSNLSSLVQGGIPDLQFLLELVHGVSEFSIRIQHVIYRLHGMNYGAMISPSKMKTDRFQ